MLNTMCKNCAKLEISCNGIECQTWTGCVYRESFKKALKRTLSELSELEAASNLAEKEYEADPENSEKEKAFTEIYKAEFTAFMVVVKLIVRASNGQINEKTARIMVQVKRNEILNFIA